MERRVLLSERVRFEPLKLGAADRFPPSHALSGITAFGAVRGVQARELLWCVPDMSPQETFVTRLRRHRQRCRVSLDEIAAETRVKRELLEALENNDLSEWPKGLYARAWIRGYAAAVGLDPGDTVDEFCRLFPQGDRRTNRTVQEIAGIVASPSEYLDEFPKELDRRAPPADAPAAPPEPAWHAPITQGVRGAWNRVANAASPYLRTRRAPRTTL